MDANSKITQERAVKTIDDGIVYDDLKDKNVARRIIYVGVTKEASEGGTEGFYAYADKDLKVKMNADELFDAYIHNAAVYKYGESGFATLMTFTPACEGHRYAAAHVVIIDSPIFSSEASEI